MARPWLRLYRDAILKPKVGRLTLEQLGFWAACLMLSDDEGGLPSPDDMAWQLRANSDDILRLVGALERNGLVTRYVTENVTETVTKWVLHDWDQHQRKSDHDESGAERQRKWREAQKAQKSAIYNHEQNRNALRHASVTLPDTDTDTDKKKEDSGSGPTSPLKSENQKSLNPEPEEPLGTNWQELTPTDPLSTKGWPKSVDLRIAARFWNQMAGEVGLPEVRALTGERSKHLAARLKDIGSLGEWFASVNAIKDQPFLTGRNDRKWRANFDWFVKPSNFSKVIENTYERSNANGRA